jgi:imidazolonepropionase-like amidohydrolase
MRRTRPCGRAACLKADTSAAVRFAVCRYLKNAITAGCDTIEHGLTMTQEEANAMVAKGLSFDPTFTRYSVPSINDDDDKNTGGRYRMIPLVTKAVSMAVATKGLPIMISSGADDGPKNSAGYRWDFRKDRRRLNVSASAV